MPSMTRVLLFIACTVLLAVTALGVLWLAGQVLVGVGAVLTGAAGVLLRLLWFLALAGAVGGVTYFLSNAWRPGRRVASAFQAAPPPTLSGQGRRTPGDPLSRSATDATVTVLAAQPELVVDPHSANASSVPAAGPGDSGDTGLSGTTAAPRADS